MSFIEENPMTLKEGEMSMSERIVALQAQARELTKERDRNLKTAELAVKAGVDLQRKLAEADRQLAAVVEWVVASKKFHPYQIDRLLADIKGGEKEKATS